ncbi:MAG TPA: hypothetical protein VMS73_05825 [Anaerolineaceae bacterium]|nr:hypothetical protein [Anaerolineaceae bacterium]
MDSQVCEIARLYAEAFRYPGPGHLVKLEAGLAYLLPESEDHYLAAFLDRVRRLSLGEWEELYTRTLDMNPPAAPYIGFQTWGESYQRGEFLALMSREIAAYGIDLDGELPDHLVPVLRYLAEVNTPSPGLQEVFAPAIRRMIAALKKVDSENPYLYLFNGLLALSRRWAVKEAE